MVGARILIVEDDDLLRGTLERALQRRGYSIASATTANQARVMLDESTFDAAILDRVLPDGDATALCSARRRSGDATPFVIFSGLGTEQDVLAGYAASADLYLRKPMGTDELSAHLVALLKRQPRRLLAIGPLTLDLVRGHLVLPDGSRRRLAPQEAAFLGGIGGELGQVVSRDALMQLVWGGEEPDSNGLDVLACRIRRKLAGHAWMLETVRGGGYRFRPARPS